MEIDLKTLNDGDLLKFLIDEKTPTEVKNKVVIERQNRKNQKEDKRHNQLLLETSTRLDRVILLLEFIFKKPRTAVFYASGVAIIVGVLVNVVTEVVLHLLKLK